MFLGMGAKAGCGDCVLGFGVENFETYGEERKMGRQAMGGDGCSGLPLGIGLKS
jgi:hypothetical protein